MFDPNPSLGNEANIIDVKEPEDERTKKLKSMRDSATWFILAGTAGLFLGTLNQAMALGGVVMIGFGVVSYAVLSVMLKKHVDDPWEDEEIDAWEAEFTESN